MNRHSLTYVDLHPEPIQEPSDSAVIAGAFALVVALCFVVVVLFSL